VATAPDKIQSGTDELFRTDVKEVWFAGGHSGTVFDVHAHCRWV
jgi:hypothetical protein